jgi:hypothetical protein
MAYLSSLANAKTFWKDRKTFVLFQYDGLVAEEVGQLSREFLDQSNRVILTLLLRGF